MKVALIGTRSFPAKHGGLEVAVEAIATELSKQGVETHVFAGSGSYEMPGITLHKTPAMPTKHLHTISQVATALPLARRLRADVVHVHGVGPALPLAATPGAFRAPTVVTGHGLDWERAKWSGLASAAFRFGALRALGNASVVTTVSRSNSSALSDALERDVLTIANGVDVTSAVEPQLDLPRAFTVLVSRLTPEKRVDWLVRQYDDEIASEFGPLVIVGSGASSHSASYEKELRSIPNSNVWFVGSQPRAVTLGIVRRASAFVSASAIEAQPIAVMEAMALGIPLALSNISTHVDLAGASASYFDLTDGGALRHAIRTCTNDMYARAEARGRAEQLTWASAASDYIAAYELAMAGSMTAV